MPKMWGKDGVERAWMSSIMSKMWRKGYSFLINFRRALRYNI